MSRLPQYAKSTDPDIISTIEGNSKRWQEWKANACAFAEEYGSDTGAFFPSTFAGRYSVLAIDAPEKPVGHGQWKRGPRGRGWAPYKNNPVHAEMAALTFDRDPIPGLPDVVHSRMDEQWRHYIATPTPFIHNGTAWVGFAWEPDPDRETNKPFGPQWSECLASEYHAAYEAVTR